MKSAYKYTYIYSYMCPHTHTHTHTHIYIYIYITYRESERITERKKRKQILWPTYRTPGCILKMN